MSSIFTDYVRSLEAAAPPALEDFNRLWNELRRVLVWELKRRHLWSRSPSYLGIYGWRSWSETEALEDLAGDCYVFVFLDRLRNLKAHAASKPNIEGLVSRQVRHFVHSVQKKRDPLGFKVFDVLRSALRRLLEEGSLHVLQGPRSIRNDTVFGSSPGEDSERLRQPFDELDVASWSDVILPALLSTRAGTSTQAVDRLAARISELPARHVHVFRFRDLVDPLKADVRSRWAQILEDLRGETTAQFEDDECGRKIVRFIALTQPDTHFEEHEGFEALANCVDRSLKRLDLRARTRDYLEKLWAFLHGYALDPESEEVPSHRKLSDLLDIPRERLPGLYETLSGLMERCQTGGSVRLGVAGGRLAAQGAAPAGARSMDGRARREQLRLRTGEAVARLAEPKTERTGPPRAGDLYVLDRTGELEWAVLLRAAGGCLLVPADTHPVTGSGDVAVGRESASGPLNLRCRFAVWVNQRRLVEAPRSGFVDAGVVARAQARMAESEEEALDAHDADRDPEYEDWTRDVLRPAHEALVEVRPRPRVRRPRTVVPYALAATLLAAVVGLALHDTALRRQLDALSEPTVNVDRHEIVFKEVSRTVKLEVDDDATHVLLPLLLRKVAFHDGYFVEIADAGGAVVWRSDLLEPRREYRLLVPRPRLPAGVYSIRLLGLADGNEMLIDEQKRQIEYSSR